MAIIKVLDLSTAHVSKPTMDWLEDWSTLMRNDYGVLVSTDMEREDMPDDLRAVLAHGAANDCQYCLLDCDADEVDCLPTFEW